MSMLAFMAAKGTAAVSTALAPVIGANTLDGFAVGMLLSGGVFLLIVTNRHGLRRALRLAVGPRLAMASFAPAVPVTDDAVRDELLLPPGTGLDPEPKLVPEPKLDPESKLDPAPELVPAPGSAAAPDQSSRSVGYQSKHRIAGPEESRAWPESRRRAPRHAAPPSALAGALSRVAGRMPFRLLNAGTDGLTVSPPRTGDKGRR
jgi:hypothetical protein